MKAVVFHGIGDIRVDDVLDPTTQEPNDAIGITGVYPPTVQDFPIDEAMRKNLSILAGNCNHRRYIPELIGLTASGAVEPDQVLTNRGGMVDAIEAYEAFDRRQSGWTKVELTPAAG